MSAFGERHKAISAKKEGTGWRLTVNRNGTPITIQSLYTSQAAALQAGERIYAEWERTGQPPR
jgi:hypothetical protein